MSIDISVNVEKDGTESSLSRLPGTGLLPHTQNCGLRIRRECRERFHRHRLQRKPLVSDPGMHHGTCVTHVPWCMSWSLPAMTGKTFPFSVYKPLTEPMLTYRQWDSSNVWWLGTEEETCNYWANDDIVFLHHQATCTRNHLSVFIWRLIIQIRV